jgi:diguanylate cyclase (GGDEF)-like protein
MCITTKNCSSRVFLVACCVAFLCFFSSSLVAETSIRFIYMGAREGLVNLGVSALVQDKTGFIWVGTQGGLQRWDGKSFTLYENEPFNTNTIPHNQIQTLFLDTDGKTLWIGTYGGLAKLDTKTGFISTWSHEPTRSESLCNNTVVSIGRDAEGRLWVGTLDGLDRKEGDTFIHYRTGKNKEGKIESSLIRSLLLDSRGDFWVGTGEGGFYKYLLETDSFKAYRKSNLPGKEIFSDQVFSIKEDQDGYLWLGLWGFGLTRFDTKTEETKNYPLADSRVYFVNTEEAGFVRAGTWGGGYFELATDSEEIKQFRKDDDSLWSLSNNTVYSMLYDTAGNTWVGTNGGGFALVLKESPAYSLYEHDPKKTGSRSSGRTLSILEDSKNRLWIGSYNTGLNRLDPGETDFVHYVHNPENPKSLPNDIVGKVFEDSKGIIWIATNQGLARYNEEDDNFDVILHDPQNPFSLADNTVQNIIEEKETGNLWFATYNKGLEYWNREENIFYHFAHDSENPTSISNNLTFALAYDAQNRLWVGTSQGLCRYEGDGIFTRYTMDVHNPRSLPSSNIRWLHTSSDNCLWIATDSGGIAVYDEESDSFSHWTKKDGLTGVNNRRALTTELKQRFEEAVLLFEPIAALMIDIDFFKLYNDYYGHQKGDEALIAVARTLKNSLDRPKDSVSRYGGEEFIVLLPSTDHVGAKVIAERMRLAVENLEIPHIVSSVKKDITISVGYASYIPRRGEEMTTIIDMADRALYRAKDAGRNCISS